MVTSASGVALWFIPSCKNLAKCVSKSAWIVLSRLLASTKSKGWPGVPTAWATASRKNREKWTAEYKQSRSLRILNISSSSCRRSSFSLRNRARGFFCSTLRWSTFIVEKKFLSDLLCRPCWISCIWRISRVGLCPVSWLSVTMTTLGLAFSRWVGIFPPAAAHDCKCWIDWSKLQKSSAKMNSTSTKLQNIREWTKS